MISFNFNISNPWSRRWQHLWSHAYDTPFKNKFLELELIKDATIVSFWIRIATRQSHGGMSLELGLLGYSFNLSFYDNRHWNYETGRYFIYSEEHGEH